MEEHRFLCADCGFVTKHYYNDGIFVCDFCGCESKQSEDEDEE